MALCLCTQPADLLLQLCQLATVRCFSCCKSVVLGCSGSGLCCSHGGVPVAVPAVYAAADVGWSGMQGSTRLQADPQLLPATAAVDSGSSLVCLVCRQLLLERCHLCLPRAQLQR